MSKVKRTFHVFDEGLHEYSITDKPTKNGRVISLFHSNGEQWTSHTRGEFIVKITVTGNGVKFSNKINKMGYDILHSMRLLINYERETDTNGYNKIKSQVYETTQDSVNNQNFEI
jgi:hypothetical protein